MMLKTMNVHISHYLEDTRWPGRVGAIVCFYMDQLIRVDPAHMSVNTRTNEWNFGHPPISPQENIIITIRYEGDAPDKCAYFERFRPDLNEPSEEARP